MPATRPTTPQCVLVALSTFKGTLESSAACAAAARGFRAAWPAAEILERPLADGGTGTVDAVIAARGGDKISVEVTGPVGAPVTAAYGMLPDGRTAVVEMAASTGLAQVPGDQRNPLRTTSHGLGQVIADAIGRGARKIMLGLGDTATVDGGIGALAALGARFETGDGEVLQGPLAGGDLGRVARVDLGPLEERIAGVEFQVLSDVDNPLCGEHGAAAVFGPQKGATPDMVRQLDEGLAGFERVLATAGSRPFRDTPGAGAAGGMGGAAAGPLRARIVSGAEQVMALLAINDAIARADLVVVGEGRMDAQSLRGKASGKVTQRARTRGLPCVGIVGLLDGDFDVQAEFGLRYVVPLRTEPGPMPTPTGAAADIERAAGRLAGLMGEA